MSSDHYDQESKRGYISAPDVRGPARATAESGEDIQEQPRRPPAGHEGMAKDDNRSPAQRHVDEEVDHANKEEEDLTAAEGPSRT